MTNTKTIPMPFDKVGLEKRLERVRESDRLHPGGQIVFQWDDEETWSDEVTKS